MIEVLLASLILCSIERNGLLLVKPDPAKPVPEEATGRLMLLSWLRSWELSLIVLVASFLRFYQIDTTEFDQDQAILFRMAHDAIFHGLLPTTSNTASIGIAHPAGVIYLFMIPALLSPNPLGGALLVGILTTLAIVLTYLFTRRYYGRLAGTIAALLYATAAKPLLYARFIWQPNVMPPFLVLFFFALFFGTVERRKGWLLPALLLLGILYQMHETTLLMVIPLSVALLLAPGTFRWRDVILAALGLAIIFFPYAFWEVSTRFGDLHTLLTLARQHAHIDGQALRFYWLFLIPYEHVPAPAQAFSYPLTPLLSWLRYGIPLLVVLGLASLVLALVLPRGWSIKKTGSGWTGLRASVCHWWRALRADPARCGLALLLVWQVIPLLILLRHAVDLHAQYFLMFLPGPFVLIGLLVARIVRWSRRQTGWHNLIRIACYVFVTFLIAAQTLGSTAWVLDITHGTLSNDAFTPYHNDLNTLKHALHEADQTAQAHHLNHVYVTTDVATQTALGYLGEQMQTPTTLFDATRCLVLPNPANGPAVLLVGPHDELLNALVKRVATATLVDTPARLGGAPFHLYLVTSPTEHANPGATFTHELQLLESHAQRVSIAQKTWQVTRWRLLRSESAHLRTTYNYILKATNTSDTTRNTATLCTLSALRAGDQLVVAFEQERSSTTPTLRVQAKSFMQRPGNPTYGPFHLETDTTHNTEWITLRTSKGESTIQVT